LRRAAEAFDHVRIRGGQRRVRGRRDVGALEQLAPYVEDSGATTIIAPQCLFANVEPLIGNGPGQGLEHVIVATYSDYLKRPSPIAVPEFVAAPRKTYDIDGVTSWQDVLERRIAPGPLTAGADDLCVMPYTSGTTGKPKGCMHTHRSVMSTLLGGCVWFASRRTASIFPCCRFFTSPACRTAGTARSFPARRSSCWRAGIATRPRYACRNIASPHGSRSRR
jgi:acyl-CoA synthetase (AMP-forming)/AMP-acid ligase II